MLLAVMEQGQVCSSSSTGSTKDIGYNKRPRNRQ